MDLLLEGTALDAAAAPAGREVDSTGGSEGTVVSKELAVATEAGVASIVKRGSIDVVGVGEPVPVLIAMIMLVTWCWGSTVCAGPVGNRWKNAGQDGGWTYGLCALVAALVLQSLLVGPDEVTVPRQEVALSGPVSRLQWLLCPPRQPTVL